MKLLNCLSDFAKIWLVCLLYDLIYVLFVELQKFKMAAIMAANMAAITTTKPHNLWTAWPIMLTFCWYINYMILHMFHLLSYKNSKWPPSWSPLKLKNPKTFEPIDKFCWYDLLTFQMIMIRICVTQRIEHVGSYSRYIYQIWAKSAKRFKSYRVL